MGAYELFLLISEICSKVLPFIGIILGIYLIVVLRSVLSLLKRFDQSVDQINKTIEEANKTIGEVNKTITEVNYQVRKLEAPLNTVSAISLSVDHVHELGKNAVSTTAKMVLENIEFLKNWILNLIHKQSDEVVEVVKDVDDIQNEPQEDKVNE